MKKRLITIVLLLLVVGSLGVMAVDEHSFNDEDGFRIFYSDGDPYRYWYNRNHWESQLISGGDWVPVNTAAEEKLNRQYSSYGLTPPLPPAATPAPAAPSPAPAPDDPDPTADRITALTGTEISEAQASFDQTRKFVIDSS